jgi:hypothetical protein
MARGAVLSIVTSALIALGLAPAADAATPTSLLLPQSTAFSLLGRSCGGVQEQAFATGFDAISGYPTGDVYLQTRCGGSGRGGGYKTTTYSAWAAATWDFFGGVRTYTRLESAPAGVSPTFSAEDAYADRVYNVLSAVNVAPANCTVGNTTYCTYRAYLEAIAPPLAPPAAPTGVTAVQSGEQFSVEWVPAAETAGLISSSTVTATPVGSAAPVLEATVSGSGRGALVGPLQPSTTYRITVTNTDAEGTSQASSPIEATSASPPPDEEPPREGAEPPEFGRCLKAPAEKEGTLTIYNGGFTTATCQQESATHTGKFEWYPGVVKTGFRTTIKPATTATLEAVNRVKVTCSGESSAGVISGPKTVAGLVISFTGCESGSQKCTTAGLAEGELESSSLEGVLAIERITFKEGKEVRHIALEIHPAGRAGPFVEYTCGGGAPTTLGGSLIAPVSSGKMLTTATLKFTATAGRQKPERLEDGVPEVLTNSLGEQVGLSVASTQTNEEPVEINPTF